MENTPRIKLEIMDMAVAAFCEALGADMDVLVGAIMAVMPIVIMEEGADF